MNPYLFETHLYATKTRKPPSMLPVILASGFGAVLVGAAVYMAVQPEKLKTKSKKAPAPAPKHSASAPASRPAEPTPVTTEQFTATPQGPGGFAIQSGATVGQMDSESVDRKLSALGECRNKGYDQIDENGVCSSSEEHGVLYKIANIATGGALGAVDDAINSTT